MREKSFHLEIFLASLALIILEISYTRIFSYKLFYFFTYLVIGISLLGLGSGGVFVTVFDRLRKTAPERLIPLCCGAAALVVPIGYVVVARLQLNTQDLASPVEILTLSAICTAVFLPFLLVGIVLATIFGARADDINRLYFADLIGAGVGCALIVPLILALTPPGCVILAGLVLALAALRLAWSEVRPLFAAVVSLSVALAAVLVSVLGSGSSGWLPEPVPDKVKTMSPQQLKGGKVLHSEWSPVFRVDLVDDSMSPPLAPRHLLIHDGMLGSSILGFDGDLEAMKSRFDKDTRATPFSLFTKPPRVLIIGSAGGQEILAALYFGAEHVTAVELNPVTVSLLTDHFAEFSGRIAHHEKVTLINDEGRTFVARDPGKYDLIWFVAPDSYSAMNAATSGAFVLSESYLYTVEMITEALAHLTPNGVICVQFGEIDFANKPNRTARYLATAREAFRRLGVDDFSSHVLLSTNPEFFTMATILLKNTPFTQAEAHRFRKGVRKVDRSVVWHAGGHAVGPGNHPVRNVISLPPEALELWFGSYPYDVRPVTDDSPFFWHFAGFWDALTREMVTPEAIWDPEDALGERVLMSLLAFSLVFAGVFLLLPLFMVQDVWSRVPHKLEAGFYFAALGLGFMFFEVSLIQQLTLFLGYPTYSLTVTLFSILIFTGIGSLLSGRYAARRNRALLALLGVLVVLMLFYQFGMAPLAQAFVSSGLGVRVVLVILWLAPLGLCLGAFMPIGLTAVSRVTSHQRQFVAWSWGVNGFFSVMASMLATILSMSIGFRLVMLTAVIIYAIGIFAMTRIPETSEA